MYQIDRVRESNKMKYPVVRLLQVSMVLLVVGLFLIACSGGGTTSGGGGGTTKHCTDEDYPLWCADAGACCPKGFPVNCGGKCYATAAQARANCDARLDTCYRE